MQLRPLTRILIMPTALGLLFFALPALAVEPNQLTELRSNLAGKRLATLQPLLASYRQQLDELENLLLRANNTTGVRNVQQEKGSVDNELLGLVKAVEPQAVVATPPPAPPIRREPITLVNSGQGLAGAASFSENNLYSFKLPEVGTPSSLTFYATGRRSTDSYGNVWLLSPEGRRTKVTKWKSSHFNTPATEIKSYQKLKPITTDISDYVKVPGTYQIEFEWTDGVDPLVIYRVEFTS